LALLALRLQPSVRATVLLKGQRPDGGWGTFAADDEASGLTGLAVLTLNALGTFPGAASRAVDWLLDAKGREASWMWKWKFRTTDTRVRFDPEKFGWAWEPGTCSWVVPTAFALLALKQSFPCCRTGRIAYRIQRGVEMLLDRACPTGGWNAGNGAVYGAPMTPHADTTAIALMALRSEPRQELIERGLEWLEHQSASCSAPWSLAWSILALDAYDVFVAPLQQRLATLAEPDAVDDTAALATVALALDCTASGNPFKVIT
jgi:squalene cyclase